MATGNRPKTVLLRDGTTVLLRAIEPDDDERLVAGFRRLSAESRYHRFFSATPELSPAMVAYLTQVDHHDHEAIGAVDPDSGDGLAIARYIRSADDQASAEVAVTVADEWQGRGLGKAVLEELADRARGAHIRRFTALVQADNPASIRLLEGLGRHRSSTQAGFVEISVDLPPTTGLGALGQLLREAARGSLVVVTRILAGASQPDRHPSEAGDQGGGENRPNVK